MLVLLLAFNCSNDCENEVVSKEEEKASKEETNTPLVCEGLKQTALALVDKSVESVANEADKCSVFLEENGLIIMEAGNTKSDYGKRVFGNAELTLKDKDASDIHTTIKLKKIKKILGI